MTLWWQWAVAALIWPGLLGGTLLGWLFMWLERKLAARLQRRFGPPFMQPLYDFFKLIGKQTVVPAGVDVRVFYALPLAAVAASLAALALLPLPGNPLGRAATDAIVLLYLLEVPALCDVLAGFVTRNPYGQVSAAREALLALGYNLPFLAAVIALAVSAGGFQLDTLVGRPWSWIHLAAAIAFLVSLPARLKSNPFSISNAEQEILAGAHTEYNGTPLALFELAHALEFTALVGLFAVLFTPTLGDPLAYGVALAGVALGVVVLIGLIATMTARIRVDQALRFYWRWGLVAAVAVFAVLLIS